MIQLFYLIVLLLSLNLGKHFVGNFSYVDGILIDYLMPTLYIQDFLIVGLLALWIWDKNPKYHLVNNFYIQILIFFLFSMGLSVVQLWAQPVFVAVVWNYVRLCFYAVFSVYIFVLKDNDVFFKAIRLFSISIFLLALLGMAQWFKQGAVFNNYLFFGEQPYTLSTPNIAREQFFNTTKVGSYGIFRHPNVFAAFLAIGLVWLLHYYLYICKSKFVLVSFALGLLTLIFTLSYVGFFAFLFGVFFVRRFKTFALILAVVIVVFSLLVPFLQTVVDLNIAGIDVSFSRRATLLKNSYSQITVNYLFGTGFGTNVLHTPYSIPRFIQPVHNIFVLIFAESGVFAIALFVLLIGYILYAGHKNTSELAFEGQKNHVGHVLYISVLQVIILGSFDHFFFTIHQTQLLLWLTLGLALKYNFHNA